MKDFDSIPLGETGQPELQVRAAAAGTEQDFFGAGDAIVLILGPDDLPELKSGARNTGLVRQVAALVGEDLESLLPPDPQVTDDPERSRRTYVYPWSGQRRRLVVVALGEESDAMAVRVQGDRVVRDLKKTGRRIGFVLGKRWSRDAEAAGALVEGVAYGNFAWTKYKTSEPAHGLEEVVLLSGESPPAGFDTAIERGRTVAATAMLAKGLTLEPPERLYPASLAARAVELAADLDTVRCAVWSPERIVEERLAGLLAVGRGATQPVAQLEYVYEPPGGAERTIVLVGKGVTYDCGGLQDKGAVMNHMNRDMGGAAAVVALMRALDRLRPAVRVVGLVGAAENMNGPDAYKTDEVIQHRDGKTTLVGHTDAEGRLVLYDQLVYARETYSPDLIIDIATLTGAVRMALGTDTFGVMSNKQGVEARERLLAAARRAGEKAWALPQSHDLPNSSYVVADYEKNFSEVMSGKSTDLDNIGNREFGAGSSTGGGFLASAIDGKVPWLHLDVAFTAMDGPMGSPVPALCHLLAAES